MLNEETLSRRIADVFKKKRLVHLCIDNQMIFPLLYHPEERDTWYQWGQDLADVTNKLVCLDVPTIHVQFLLEEGDKELLQKASNSLPVTVDDVFYDKETFKIYLTRDPFESGLPLIQSDLLNKNSVHNHVFFKEHEDAFMPETTTNRSLLKTFLNKNKFDTLLISGLYADDKSCVRQTVLSALSHGFSIILLDNCIRFRDGKTMKEQRKNTASSNNDPLFNLDHIISDEIMTLLQNV